MSKENGIKEGLRVMETFGYHTDSRKQIWRVSYSAYRGRWSVSVTGFQSGHSNFKVDVSENDPDSIKRQFEWIKAKIEETEPKEVKGEPPRYSI